MKLQPRQLTQSIISPFVSGELFDTALARFDNVRNWKMRKRTVTDVSLNPLGELLSIAVKALYDIHLIHFNSNICPISSLCLMHSFLAAIKWRIGPSASGNMGTPCYRSRQLRSRIGNVYRQIQNEKYFCQCQYMPHEVIMVPYRIRLSAVITYNLQRLIIMVS